MPRKKSDNKPLLIGESPSKTGDRYHMFPLSGAVAQRLCELAGIPPQEEGSRFGRWTWALYDHFDCINLFERHAEASPWRPVLARARFGVLVRTEAPRTIICLGRKVQRAALEWFDGRLAYGGDGFYDWNIAEGQDGSLIDLVAIPHPSALNKTLNSAEQRELCGVVLREALTR